jgi:hypothetical protein
MAAAIVFVLISFFLGCAASTRAYVDRENVPQFAEMKIIKLTLTNGNVVKFDRAGGRYYEQYKGKKHVIAGRAEDGQIAVIELDRVSKAYVESATEEGNGMFFPALIIVGFAVAIL